MRVVGLWRLANTKAGIYRPHVNLFVLILINWTIDFDMKAKLITKSKNIIHPIYSISLLV